VKRAYIASVEIEIAVVATDEKDAQDVAYSALRDEIHNLWKEDFTIRGMSHIPSGYSSEDLVYNNLREDITVDEAAKLPGGYDEAAPGKEASIQT
jgi:hypothetical protein